MKTDLLESKATLCERWALSRDFTKTSDVLNWGRQNFYNRAVRTIQELAACGYLRRLTYKEKDCMGFKTGEGVWTRIGCGESK